MSYHGLGQTGSSTLRTLAPRSAELRLVQTRLSERGYIPASAVDGVVSSGTSPTLSGLARFATDSGLSSTGTARTSTGGLTIPGRLYDAVTEAEMSFTLDETSSGGGTTSVASRTVPPSGTSTSKGGGSAAMPTTSWRPSAPATMTGPSALPSAVLPASSTPTWLPWAIGGAVLFVGGVAIMAMRR